MRLVRQIIRCPVCQKGRLLDAAPWVDLTQLHLYRPDHASHADFFSKCPKCGAQIGFTFKKL